MGGFYAVELLGGVFVSALIKEVLRQQEAHLRHVHVLVVLLEEGPGLCLRVLRLQLQRRHRPDGLRISAAVSLRLLNGLRVESALIVFRGFLQVLGLHLRAHQNQRQCYLYLLHLYLLLSFCFFLPSLLPGSFLFGLAFHPSCFLSGPVFLPPLFTPGWFSKPSRAKRSCEGLLIFTKIQKILIIFVGI